MPNIITDILAIIGAIYLTVSIIGGIFILNSIKNCPQSEEDVLREDYVNLTNEKQGLEFEAECLRKANEQLQEKINEQNKTIIGLSARKFNLNSAMDSVKNVITN